MQMTQDKFSLVEMIILLLSVLAITLAGVKVVRSVRETDKPDVGEPINLEDGWYYFVEPAHGNVLQSIMTFSTNATNRDHLKLDILVPSGSEYLGVWNKNGLLFNVIVRYTGTTNGYFVHFRRADRPPTLSAEANEK